MMKPFALLTAAVIIMASAAAHAFNGDISPLHFFPENRTGWDTEATGHMILSFECPVHHERYATLHDIVHQGFGVTKLDANEYPFPVLYFKEESDAGPYGYVVRAHAAVYIRLAPLATDDKIVRWIILAIDPAEDGLNGNEILR